VNILKVKKAFSNSEVPHYPASYITFSDLLHETGLSHSDLIKALDTLQKEKIIYWCGRTKDGPAHAQVEGGFEKLMEVDYESELKKQRTNELLGILRTLHLKTQDIGS